MVVIPNFLVNLKLEINPEETTKADNLKQKGVISLGLIFFKNIATIASNLGFSLSVSSSCWRISGGTSSRVFTILIFWKYSILLLPS